MGLHVTKTYDAKTIVKDAKLNTSNTMMKGD